MAQRIFSPLFRYPLWLIPLAYFSLSFSFPSVILASPSEQKILLGSGSIGDVFLELNGDSRQVVAKKWYKPDALRLPDAMIYLKGYTLAQGLDHPGIVRVYDITMHEEKNANAPTVSMEYVPGFTLENIVKTQSYTESDIKAWMRSLLGILSFLEKKKILHRDVKLGNVICRKDSHQLVLLDWDYSVHAFAPYVTHMGTPNFISPELLLQVISQKSQTGLSYNLSKSDIWAAGIILYYLVYKKSPYVARSSREELYQEIINPEPISFPPTFQGNPVPDELQQLLRSLLDKDPVSRWSATRALARSVWLGSFV